MQRCKTWNKLYSNIDVKIILIAKKIPDEYIEYKENIILFTPIENVSTKFISQYIRLLYPCILNYKNGIMITDIDMIPMNKSYYTENISNYTDNKFIYMRSVLLNKKEIAMCYNIALPNTWKEIFNIKTIDDIINRIKTVYLNNRYDNKHGGIGWSIDQKHLYKYVIDWNKKTNNFIYLKEKDTLFNRLNRHKFNINDSKIIENISKGLYTDYHCLRPMKKYSKINNIIYNLL